MSIKPSARMQKLEAKLGPLKAKAAYLLLAIELKDTEENGISTIEGVANECNVSKVTIHNWKKEPAFIEYKNAIADDFLLEKRAIVNRKLMSLIDTGQPSVKAIDLYYRRFGLLTDRQIVEQQEGPENQNSNDQIEENTKEIEALLEEGNE